MAQLAVLQGPDAGTTYDLERVSVLGRGRQCGIVLSDGDAADRHVKIVRKEDGHFFRDLSPLKSLSVNGKSMNQGWLKAGDLLKVGATVLVFSGDEAIDVPEELDEAEIAAMVKQTKVSRKYDSALLPILEMMDGEGAAEDRIESLLKVGETIATHDTLSSVLRAVLDVILETFDADRGSVILFDEEKNKFQRGASRVAEGRGLPAKHAVSRSIMRELHRRRESLLLVDAQDDERFAGRASIAEGGVQSVMAVPLMAGDQFRGLLVVETATRRAAFVKADLDLLTAMGNQAAMAIENARLMEAAKEKALLERELELAEEIQRRVLPASPPARDDLEVFGAMFPAQGVGGDYFDFIDMGGDLLLAAGTASGEKLVAGLIMMMARSFLRPLAEVMGKPARIMEELNQHMMRDTLPDAYMTFLLLRWSPETRTAVFCTAGYENLLLLKPGTSETEGVVGRTQPLGVDRVGEGFQERRFVLAPGAVLLLYSDGLVEAKDEAGRRFGLDRLKASLAAHRDQTARKMVGLVLEDVSAFCGQAPRQEDVTLVAARVPA